MRGPFTRYSPVYLLHREGGCHQLYLQKFIDRNSEACGCMLFYILLDDDFLLQHAASSVPLAFIQGIFIVPYLF